MLKSKIYKYAYISSIVFLIGCLLYLYQLSQSQKKEILKIKTEKRDTLKKVRDSAYVEIDNIIKESKKKFDSIINIPPKIKLIPYEKPVYPNRSLDDALRIHADNKANKRTDTKN